MKKKKTNKKIASALAMLMLSAAMLGTSTYAWFTMNKTVSVTGMKLKATAEQGLVISDYAEQNWATSQNVNMTAGAVLAPTSAAAVASPSFVKNESQYFDNAEADQADDYAALTLDWSAEAATSGSIGSVTVGSGASAITTNYVLKRTFYIKSTGDTAWAVSPVIDEVTVEGVSNTGDLDKSLRVLVVMSDQGTTPKTNAFIYAPLTGATTTYNWKGTASGATEVKAVASTTDSTCSQITSIPAGNTSTPIKVDMYMYFEGEDANCKSSNISGLTVDELTVSAKFKTSDGPADN